LPAVCLRPLSKLLNQNEFSEGVVKMGLSAGRREEESRGRRQPVPWCAFRRRRFRGESRPTVGQTRKTRLAWVFGEVRGG
jgi:hypothetical protein